MHDVFPKFIIEDGEIIIGKVTFHKHLATDKTKVTGGGSWSCEYGENKHKLILTGKSQDFGPANIEELKKAVNARKVFDSAWINISSQFDVFYIDELGQTIQL